MLTRLKALLGFTVVVGAFAAPTTAEARDWFRFPFFEPRPYTYYADPDDIYDPYYYGNQREYYNQRDSYYDPQYDEPVYVKPRKKKTAKIAPKDYTAPKKSAAVAPKKASKPTQQTTNLMSCDKAGKIISGYGFSSVKPTSCKGQVYAFNATRGGKAYLIRLSSASGELTEVKKVQ
jgi:hypothetical protein